MRYVLKLFLAQRLAITLVGVVAAALTLDAGSATNFVGSVGNYLVTPWGQWDTLDYLDIAQYGYAHNALLPNFPPLYPALIKLVGILTASSDNRLVLLTIALLISSIAYWLTLRLLFKLVTLHYDEQVARYSCLALACFPTSFFFLMGYTESIFLALTLACFYLAFLSQTKPNGNYLWFIACIMAALAALVRLQGILLMLPLAYLYWQHYSWKLNRRIWGLAFLPLGSGLFQLYIILFTNHANTLTGLAQHWNIQLAAPPDTLVAAIIATVRPDSLDGFVHNAWGLLTLGVIVYLLWKGRHQIAIEYHIYAWSNILLYLLRKADQHDVTYSIERYLILIFPAFIVLGLVMSKKFGGRKRNLNWMTLLIGSLGLQLLMSLAFVEGLWVG